MRDYINEQSPVIRQQIESTQNLKNDLLKFEIKKSEVMDQKVHSNQKLKGQNRFQDRYYPIPFFIDEDME